ncbi:hypothetical protein MW887_000926 [Aspergillus wentii]|nr:hypothetical protein MW887_000926 [Aspergillus wentii]
MNKNGIIREEGDVYHYGGFHPVHFGEVYNGKYEVLRKLGYGRYSTVWLVENTQNKAFKALKVLSAECYGESNDIYEREILQHLRDADPSHLGYGYISTLLDSFEHDGPNGRHVCLVFDVMVMRRFTFQLLIALDYAHDCGVVHTDIKPSNIMVKIKNESVISDLYLPNNPPDPAAYNSSTDPSIIKCQPLKHDYFHQGADFLDFDIVLGDWGVASWTRFHLSELIQPVALRSPEVLIKGPWGPSTDLWNLGAVLLEVFRAVRMFSRVNPSSGDYEIRVHLHEIVDLFGPFPKPFLERGDQGLVKKYFDDEGRIKDLPPLDRPGLESEAFMGELNEEDRRKFVMFLESLMKIDPAERKSTMELLATPWIDAVKPKA